MDTVPFIEDGLVIYANRVFDFPVIIAASPNPGMVNHTMLTLNSQTVKSKSSGDYLTTA